MSYTKDRDEFFSIMGAEGVPVSVTRTLLREASTLQRLAELECSSERADRDQVRCPAGRITATAKTACLCQDYGSYDAAATVSTRVHTCRGCAHIWRAPVTLGATPNISGEVTPFCPTCGARGVNSAPIVVRPRPHGTIPRHMVQSAASVARVVKLCTAHGLTPHFGGDPRGCMLVISVPSQRTNDWERRGIAVPAQGYTAAQMDRITR